MRERFDASDRTANWFAGRMPRARQPWVIRLTKRLFGSVAVLAVLSLGGGFDWPENFDADAVAAMRDDGGLPTLAPFDRLAESLIREHRLPGLAIAVTDGGRLVHAAGYGCADLETGEGVKPTSLFRIASLSKPLTAVAILRLVGEGKLRLEDPVVPYLGLDDEFALRADQVDPRWNRITIERLLEHRGGWDRDQSFDAMFQAVRFAEQLGIRPPAGHRDVIRAMLVQPLDFDPGERYAYSNFGYNLLGRVIERQTGRDYESYVREEILAPLGIERMRIGATRSEGRAAGEVRYYHPGDARSVFADDAGRRVPSRAVALWRVESRSDGRPWGLDRFGRRLGSFRQRAGQTGWLPGSGSGADRTDAPATDCERPAGCQAGSVRRGWWRGAGGVRGLGRGERGWRGGQDGRCSWYSDANRPRVLFVGLEQSATPGWPIQPLAHRIAAGDDGDPDSAARWAKLHRSRQFSLDAEKRIGGQ